MRPSSCLYALLFLGSAAAQIVTRAPSPTSVSAVSECHILSSTQYCIAGTAEYRVVTPATRTAELPSLYTSCHSHASEIFCLAPGGEEVEIVSVEQVTEGHEHEEHEEHDHEHDHEHEEEHTESKKLKCHFHAGVEHCTGGSESDTQRQCEKVDRDYNIPLRIGLLFVMLVTSAIGVFSPIILRSSRITLPQSVFTILKQFGTGVVFSTAFVHLFTHANVMFGNECLGDLGYEGTTSAIVMAGIFLSFLIEYVSYRYIQWRKTTRGEREESCCKSPSTETLGVAVMEGGIIFHSLLIGVTLVVAGDSFFITLFIVIMFHQMFEGLALGSRIAELSNPNPTNAKTNSSSSESLPSPSTADNHPSNNPISTRTKLVMGSAFAFITPIGMAIGIGVLNHFNGNDPATLIAIGTLDALSAGILIWVAIVEMWAHDWVYGHLATAPVGETVLGLAALMLGAGVMSVLAKWA